MFIQIEHNPDTGMQRVTIAAGIDPLTARMQIETPEQIIMEVHDYAEVAMRETRKHGTRIVHDNRGDVYLASKDSFHWETREDLTGAELPPRPGAPDYREHIDRYI